MDKHIPVLLNECLDLLNIKENGIYVDGTLGRAGHSIEISKRLNNGKLYCFDLDNEAIKQSQEIFKGQKNVFFIHDNFANMNKYVDKVDGILLDLGVSSPQFDDSSRGFSYRYDSPLDMRMNLESALSAKDVVNKYSEEELYRIIKDYGEEKFAKNIARNICKAREIKDIETTFELVDIIKKSLPNKVLNKKGHPAKQTFQAIRIEVNNELASINKFLETFDDILNIDGRVVIITFHSLEDRLVKNKFKELSSIKDDLNIPKRPEEIEKARYELLNRKVIIASKQELEVNNRAKSAKVRGVRKIYGKDS